MSLVGNTRKFVNKVADESLEITLANALDAEVNKPYILVTPTYDAETTDILRDFLENPTNLNYCQGIFGGGNRNFAGDFCYTAKDLGRDFDLPVLHLFEFQGSPQDVERLKEELNTIE